jgi:predicted metal-dependent peptidase
MNLIGFNARCKKFVLVLSGRRLMVNYKIVNEHTISVTNNYVEYRGDILEIKTDQIVVKGMRMSKAKEMVRHLNFGGGFDGSTPAFFLAESAKMLDSSQQSV